MTRLTDQAFAHHEREPSHALPAGHRKGRLLTGAAAASLRHLPIALALGIALPGAAGAAPATVNPVQNTTYTLTAGANPITFGPNTLINAVGAAVYGDNSTSWTVTNDGSLKGTTDGVSLKSSSTVTNNGVISASAGAAVYLANGGTVQNQAAGTMSGTYGVLGKNAAVTVTNAGTMGFVDLEAGGTVTNQAGGTITGAGDMGVYITGDTGTVTNGGTITASVPIGGVSVVTLEDGGTVTNQASGTIVGGVTIVGSGTLTNAGIINNGGVTISTGSLTNQSGGSIVGTTNGVIFTAGPGTVTNAGTIASANAGVAGVQLEDGGSVSNQSGGSITGGKYGVLVSNGPGAVTNAGTISGSTASVEFQGTGANTLTLLGGSTLTGDAVGSTAVGATNALILQGAKGSANNNFDNFNTLTVSATGSWALNGVSTIGTTTVSTGDLIVGDANHLGAKLTSTVSVDKGATLSGHGTIVGDVTNNGTVQPGGSIGSLTINGNFSQGSKATLAIEVSPTASSQLLVTGSATLDGTLQLVTDAGVYRDGQQFHFLTAGSISGAFTTLTATNGLPFSVSGTATTETATLLAGNLALTGGTLNQNAVVGAFNHIPIGAGDFDAVATALIALGPGPAQNAAANELGNELYPDFISVARVATRGFLNDMTQHLDDRFAGAAKDDNTGGEVWGHGYGRFDSSDSDANAHGYSSNGGGIVAGADYNWSSTTLGGAFAYDHAQVSVGGLPQSGSEQTYGGAIFAEQRLGVWYANGAVSWSGDNGNGVRRIDFSGLNRRATASTSGSDVGAIVTLGARMHNGSWLIEPSMAYVYTDLRLDSLTESGAGSADLAIASQSQSAGETLVGMLFSRSITLGSGTLDGEAKLAWGHELSNVAPRAHESFPVAPGANFVIAGDNINGDAAIFGVGLNYKTSGGLIVYGHYDGAFSHVDTYNAFNVGLRWDW